MRNIRKVEVISKFPGFEVGDILALNEDSGLFNFTYNNNDDSDNPLDMLTNAIDIYKPYLSKESVIANLGTYFKDVSNYEIKSIDQIKSRIRDLRDYINDYKSKGDLSEEAESDRNVAITVWQNMIWELEWVLGKRTI